MKLNSRRDLPKDPVYRQHDAGQPLCDEGICMISAALNFIAHEGAIFFPLGHVTDVVDILSEHPEVQRPKEIADYCVAESTSEGRCFTSHMGRIWLLCGHTKLKIENRVLGVFERRKSLDFRPALGGPLTTLLSRSISSRSATGLGHKDPFRWLSLSGRYMFG
jgi:hypothetical protein